LKSIRSQLKAYNDGMRNYAMKYQAYQSLRETLGTISTSLKESRGHEHSLEDLIHSIDLRAEAAYNSAMDMADELKVVDNIISSLDNERWKLCLTLRYMSCLRWREIAKVMDISEQAAKDIERRAVEWLEI
jgi:DNA-directed RNA polymerase specialized sigma subunit